MKKNSRETDSRSVDKEHFVWYLKVHHLVHKRLLHSPALSQLNPTHNLSPYPPDTLQCNSHVYCHVSHMVPFAQGFQIKSCLLFPHRYSHLTHPDLITSTYLVRTNHDAPHSTIIIVFQFRSLSARQYIPLITFYSNIHNCRGCTPQSLLLTRPTVESRLYFR